MVNQIKYLMKNYNLKDNLQISLGAVSKELREEAKTHSQAGKYHQESIKVISEVILYFYTSTRRSIANLRVF